MNLYGLLDAIIKKVNRAVKVEKQELDNSLQKQARENINVPSKSEICNPNFLDNWYFANPVNQRGQQEYNVTWQSIDRWITDSKLTINENGIKVSAEGEHWGIQQTIFCELDRNRCFTGSVFLTEVTGTVTLLLQEAGGTWNCPIYKDITTPGVYSITGTIPSFVETTIFNFGLLVKSGSAQITAIKFEEGEFQTLAHQDTNGNWVLNEIPKYSEELLKCRQYDPYTGEYIGLRKFSQPRNLLDNSDFTNPVNQRGTTSTTNLGYFIDRWTIGVMDGNVTLHDGYISLTENSNQTWFVQYFERAIPVGTQVTAAFCDINNEIHLTSTQIIEGGDGFHLGDGHFWIAPNQFSLVPSAGTTWNIKWVALYEGAYTVDTLPEYQPKGYAAELAECQRYFQVIPFNSNFNMPVAVGTRFSATAARIPLVFPQEFRIPPTMTIDSTVKLNVAGGGTAKAVENSGISISTSVKNKVVINVTSSDLVSGHPVVLYGAGEQGSGIQCIRFSADL